MNVVVAPVRERGLKCLLCKLMLRVKMVAPVRERGLKFVLSICLSEVILVAPVRERGLKSDNQILYRHQYYRLSREGAWIEMLQTP